MSTVLDQTVAKFVNDLFFTECAHTAAQKAPELYYQSVGQCIECSTRAAVRFAAAHIAVGRRLEREEREALHAG